jgi:hypothetical protein
MDAEEFIDAATTVFTDTNVRLGPSLFDGTPALDDGVFEVNGLFDWDPCDGGPSGATYRDYEWRITEHADVPETLTWDGETYDCSLSVGCLTEYDDHLDGTTFDVSGGVPATASIEENDYGHPRVTDSIHGLDQLAWYRELVGVSAVQDGIDATGGLWWRGPFFGMSATDAPECACCAEPIPNSRRGYDSGTVTAWEVHPWALDDSWGSDAVSAELCLYCVAETFGLSFAGDERMTAPNDRETLAGGWGGGTVAMSKPLYTERVATRERLNG